MCVWVGVTSALSQSLGSLLVLCGCWKICVMMGAICSAVAGSSSGPVALFWLRFSNCLIIPFVPISRGACWSKMKDLLPEWGIFRW